MGLKIRKKDKKPEDIADIKDDPSVSSTNTSANSWGFNLGSADANAPSQGFDPWKIMDAYFNQSHILVNHQLESYNRFIEEDIPNIINQYNPIVVGTDYDTNLKEYRVRYEVRFKKIYMSKPVIQESCQNDETIRALYPNESRLRNLTYWAPLFVDVEHKIVHLDESGNIINPEECQDMETYAMESKIPLARIPIMLHSKYCHLNGVIPKKLAEFGECTNDLGGYFIINGSEKVIIAQERMADNQILCFPETKANSKYSERVEIKSTIDQRYYPVKNITVLLRKEPSIKDTECFGRVIHVTIPYIKTEIPLFVVFRALNVISDKDIFKYILWDLDDPDHERHISLLRSSADEATKIGKGANQIAIFTQLDALDYISKHLTNKDNVDTEDQNARTKYVHDILAREFLPHTGPNFQDKAYFLGYMTRHLIECHLGIRKYDDRDHYINKRVDLSGPLLSQIFRNHFQKLVRELKNYLIRDLDKINAINPSLRKNIQNCTIESKIKYALSTGNWSTQNRVGEAPSSKKGIAQVLQRLSYIGCLSHLRRIQTPLEKSGSKLVPPRRLHTTQFGLICPNETPEGHQVGVVKNKALLCNVSMSTSTAPVEICLRSLGMKNKTDVSFEDLLHCVKVLVNGDWIGVLSNDVYQVYNELKRLKQSGVLKSTISITWFYDRKKLEIKTDGGRYCRPLLTVKDNELLIRKLDHLNYSWDTLVTGNGTNLDMGVIEYLDAAESEQSMIAMTPKNLEENQETNQSYSKYTHCEIHPVVMMGIVGSMIPLSDHNQAPRNCYQCLWKEEKVVMADGCLKRIDDVRIGDSVVTVDPITLNRSTANVINQYTRTTDKPMVRVSTISGRELVCTSDHLVLTDKGWQQAGDLTDDDMVVVCPLINREHCASEVILDERCQYSIDHSDCDFERIQKMLPIYYDSGVLRTLTQILSRAIRHGRLDISYLQIDFDNYQEMLEFVKIVDTLGFNEGQILDFSVIYRNEIYLLLKLLGMNNSGATPAWVLTGPQYIQDLYYGNDSQGLAWSEWKLSDKSIPFIDWSKKHVRIQNGSLFVRVKNVISQETLEISDITIDSENQSFITGNQICVHNSSMGKQAMTIYTTNYNHRMDTMGHVLTYPQRPIVSNRISKYINIDRLPQGIQTVVAIASYTGYNQEDSLIINRSAIDRGLFNSLYFRTYVDKQQEHKTPSAMSETFGVPDRYTTKDMKTKPENYRLLGSNGIAKIGSEITGNEVIIGKILKLKPDKRQPFGFKDLSIMVRHNETGLVDKVMPTENGPPNINADGEKFAKVRVSKLRKPEIGDKFASRSAQKGTCGMLYNQEDMPFTDSGITPDMIMNPHAIPSRMTIGQVLECLMGKAGCLTGRFFDSTPFEEIKQHEIEEILAQNGFDRHGEEILYSGQTGEQLKTTIFIGPTYYQRLKHLVGDKMHSRDTGPVNNMTRQPSEGRSRDGGLRLGEMERDALLGHGSAGFLKERTMDSSDMFKVYISKEHESMIIGNGEEDRYIYNGRDLLNDDVFETQMPYAMKLLLHEMQSMGVDTRLNL